MLDFSEMSKNESKEEQMKSGKRTKNPVQLDRILPENYSANLGIGGDNQ